jgi:hypothetical protein
LKDFEQHWKGCAHKLGIWKAILAWAPHKKEDNGKEQEYGRDGQEALKILRDIEDRAMDACSRIWRFTADPIDIEQSTTTAIKEEYDLLCHHSALHTDDDGRVLQCCIRKRLFNKMLGQLPKLPPVRKR